ncbi:phospholipase C [Chthonomonas calidirosea]|uniref:alkaline phosphatase family protein n=1 Tax=Chthonomonas calidirosea TaxID=454171 RepID=UPI0006DD402D|nr:alkaline phosphatase family protein [Chthonomonas calidirosea]CEK17745.1 phospholipase C [Chthonomonas calidirosea]
MGLHPADPHLKGTGRFLGDDDHPGDSDSQISEAFVAECVNQIAKSPYWRHCAIIITWDDSEGDYDHVPPPLRALGPDGHWLSDGPRVPLLFLSPYARTHYIAHASGDTASVVKFIDSVFGLVPLADLPAEAYARRLGYKRYHQANLGPFDDKTSQITDLTCCLDPARLMGWAAPLPPSYALISEKLIHHLPQQTGIGWRWAGVEPVDRQRHLPNVIPSDFNPRP